MGVHYSDYIMKSPKWVFYKFVQIGPFAWMNEKIRKRIYDQFFIFLIKLFLIVYLIVPHSESYRRRSVFWQVAESCFLEERFLDFTLMFGYRRTLPQYFFLVTLFLSISREDYSNVVFEADQEEVLYTLWRRKNKFASFKKGVFSIIDFFGSILFYFLQVVVPVLWCIFIVIYSLVYFFRVIILVSLESDNNYFL